MSRKVNNDTVVSRKRSERERERERERINNNNNNNNNNNYNNNNKGSRVTGGVVPFLAGLPWRPRLVSPHQAPCEA